MIFRLVLALALCLPPLLGEAAQAPALIVTDIGGQRFDLHALKGKPVVIAFWASWCASCLAEIPALSAAHKKGVTVLGLSVDRKHDEEDARRHAAKMDYPIAFASQAEENGFDVPGALPVVYVIGRDGEIKDVFDEGGVTPAALEAALKK